MLIFLHVGDQLLHITLCIILDITLWVILRITLWAILGITLWVILRITLWAILLPSRNAQSKASLEKNIGTPHVSRILALKKEGLEKIETLERNRVAFLRIEIETLERNRVAFLRMKIETLERNRVAFLRRNKQIDVFWRKENQQDSTQRDLPEIVLAEILGDGTKGKLL